MRKTLTQIALTLALLVPSGAFAQHAEQPAGDHADHGEGQVGQGMAHGAGGEGHEAAGAGHDEHGDPSKHFNFTDGIDLSYKNKDNEGGPLGDNALGPDKRPLPPGTKEEPMSVPFVLVLVNFGLLLAFFAWKVRPMAGEMAAKRSDEIKTALDEAARLRAQAASKLEEYSSKLKAAETEIDTMIKGMRADAEAERQRIIAAAEAQAAALQRDAEQQIAAEIARSRALLQREVVAAANGVAEKLLKERTTPADQNAMVDAFVRGVAS